MNLDFAKVCGKHSAIYEAYYKQIDPKSSGAIEALTAAKFLKKSGLSDVVLSRVWDLSDPNGKGFLDKPGFFVALKLVSLAQAGQVINMSNIYVETANPPKVGDLPKIMPPRLQNAPAPVPSGGATTGDWSISVIDRLKYEQLFESLKPVAGMLAGNKVKGVLMDSKLPMEILGKIWDLADQDKDGNLDKHEFLVAMHLVYQTLEKRTVPDVLPPELRKPGAAAVPPPKPAPPTVAANAPMPRAPSGEGFGDGGFVANFPQDIAPPPPPPVIPPLPVALSQRVPPVGGNGAQPLISTDPLIPIAAPPSVTANADWVVTPAELKRFEITFRDSDRDKDGLVSGLEVKNVFLQSGVPQNCLAHIWALCDTNQSGKLTLEQFALAMWMVERKQKGIEPPNVLTANMVPPSMRNIVSGVDIQPQAEPKPTYSNPELEMISKEIEELAKERRALETEIAQKEADIRIKSGEVRSLQSELDTLSATLKQLENQRGEAQKRLDDLKTQVNKIREQCHKQEETINEQEGELNTKRSELQKLKDEEAALQKEYDENNRELQKLTQHLQNTQLQISSVRSMVTQLMETQRQMTDALIMCRAAIENQDAELVSEYQLKIEPDFDEARKTMEKKIEEPKSDPFEDNSSTTAKATSNGFATNGFDNDPFGANMGDGGGGGGGVMSTARAGFDDSFGATSGFDSGFDAFGNSSAFNQQKDPFGADAFGANKTNAITPEPGKDDFGSDPFAALHAPTGQGQVLSPNAQKSGPPPRPESPSPALPPKKSKVPPPRPAPPRPNQGPARPAQPTMDAFGSSSNTSGGFADFADFDNKLSSIPAPSQSLPRPLPLLHSSINSTIATNATTSSSTSSSATTITPLTTSSLLNLNSSSLFDGAITKNPSTITPITTTTPISAFASAFDTASTSVSTTASTLPSLASSIMTTTKANISTSTISNHLTRSITPLQQAATALSLTTATATKSRNGNSEKEITGKGIKGPTDFAEDPFKDYRYEDPFSIKDPFTDDDVDTDPEKIFKDDLSSDDDGKSKDTSKSTTLNDSSFKTINSTTSQTFSSAKSQTPTLSNEFLNQFDAFNMNPSPVPSQQSSTTSGAPQSITPIPNSSAIGSGNGVGSGGGSSIGGGSGGGGGGNLFDNFADFDAFSTKSSNSGSGVGSAIQKSKITTTTNMGVKTGNDSFFDAFNDNFIESNSNVETKSSNTNIFDAFGTTSDSKKNVDAFDAFPTDAKIITANAITKSSKVFDDDFNENTFEDDFFKGKNTASTTSTTNASEDKNINRNNNSNNDNFAKFDAFNDSNNDFAADFSIAINNSINTIDHDPNSKTTGKLAKVQNSTTITKTSNKATLNASTSGSGGDTDGVGGGGGGGSGSEKVAEKFAADYSKTDHFDADLQEALKRSMLEQ